MHFTKFVGSRLSIGVQQQTNNITDVAVIKSSVPTRNITQISHVYSILLRQPSRKLTNGISCCQLLLPTAVDLQHGRQRAHCIIHLWDVFSTPEPGREGIIWLPQLGTCTRTYTFNLLVSTVICFAHIEIQLCLQSSYLGFHQRGWIFIQAGYCLYFQHNAMAE